nr:meiotic nuclear division protein 1 homolog [Tanacetum cinerariifolium]
FTFGVFLVVWKIRNVSKRLESELQSSKKRHIEIVEQCESMKKGREDSDAREEALIELKAIKQKYHSVRNLEQYEYFTDNIFTMRQWCSKNFPQGKEQLEHLYNEILDQLFDIFLSLLRPVASSYTTHIELSYAALSSL